MKEALWLYLCSKDIRKLQLVLDNSAVSPNMLLPPAPGNPYFCQTKRYNLLNWAKWACYHESPEGVAWAFLLFKGGDPFLSRRDPQQPELLLDEEKDPFVRNLLFCHWDRCAQVFQTSILPYSQAAHFAYILAMMNYHDNSVTNLGRKPYARD